MLAGMVELQNRLGYQFADQALLERALTHRSCGARNNERLEFLGDSVINYLITEFLYLEFGSASEGEMTRSRAAMVNGDALAELARELKLGGLIKLGPGALKNGGRHQDSILADTLEAVVGAMLLDSDMKQCRPVLLQWFRPRLDSLPAHGVGKDSKTRLQEFLQGRGQPLPHYQLEQVTGSGHCQEFLVRCELPEFKVSLTGKAFSRRKAEQEAAGRALQALQERNEQG